MEDPGKQPPDFAATEFSAEIRARVKNHSARFTHHSQTEKGRMGSS